MGWRRVLYLLTLGGCMAFYMMYRMWLSGLALTAVLALPWFSLLVSLPAMVSTTMELEHPGTVSMGEEAVVKLDARCRLPGPPCRGRLEIRSTMTGEEWDDKRNSILPTDHCGQLEILVRGCWVYDYLGLFRIPLRKKPQGKVLVRPKPVPLDNPPDLTRFMIRSWRPKRGGGFGENHELRLYRPGDNLQQIHWKLTAKTGKLILRETVEPERGLMLIKLELVGEEETLDRKLGQLLWLSRYLLANDLHHEIRALTGAGLRCFPVKAEPDLSRAVDQLLACPCAREGAVQSRDMAAAWEYMIGGGPDEA